MQNLMRNMATMCNSIDIDFNYDAEDAGSKLNEPYEPIDPFQLNGLSLSEYINNRRSSTPGSSSSLSSTGSSVKRKADSPLGDSIEKQHVESTPSRKRKCVQKPGQNLCHCQTEKKRRAIISQGYQTLSDLVPALGNHHYTRKYILRGAAEYIMSLTQGNDELRRQLNGMVKQENETRDSFESDAETSRSDHQA